MSSTDLEGNIILKYCRGKEYFVDPSSSKRFELGTRLYPFKCLDDPFRELFSYVVTNAITKLEGTYNIFIKSATNLTLHSIDMPLILLNT